MMMKTTYKTFSILFIMFISALLFSCQFIAASGKGDKMIDDTSMPKPKLTNKIDLSYVGKASCISRLAFSPDGRYLAIVDDPYPLMSTIIIWDLHQGREQTRIENLPPHTNDPDTNLLWGADGKYITFGKGFNEKYPIQFWDPMTGKLIKELAVSSPCGSARLNRDKTKMLVRTGDQSFRIYNTKTWEFKDYDSEGLGIISISWTSEDKVLIAGIWPPNSVGKTLDGKTPKPGDSLARLVDPSGKQSSRFIVVSGMVPSGRAVPPMEVGFWPYYSIVDYAGNKIALNYSKIIDGTTLEILTYASNEDIKIIKYLILLKSSVRTADIYICWVLREKKKV
ncbi:MAG: WD40 repeat domain-containing protein [Syntrophaceae bacterium]|nr:WD40 repeat domain-containing protein [Syntrophaceae bacterium]